jgi:hypothetical protein
MTTPHIPSARERDAELNYWLTATRTPDNLHEEILQWQARALADGREITYTEARDVIHKARDRERILELLNRLTDEERLDIFTEYCRACGGKDPTCQCWNDE